MTTTVTRHRRPSNQKRVSNGSVFLRYAEERKIAESTAADWFYGKVGSPLYDVERMAAVAARHGRLDMIEGFMQRLRAATAPPLPYDEARIAYHNADTIEEMTQGEFDEKERKREVTEADVRKRVKSINLETATARQYQDSLLAKYGL